MVLDEVKDKYKEYAKFFQEYDRPPQHEHQPIATKEKNLDPFKKINWKNQLSPMLSYCIQIVY